MQVKDRLFKALGDQIEGDVLDSDLSRSLYSSGASLYRIKPRAIVQPRSTNDLVAIIRFSREHKIPITARGGGTSRTGNELGEGIVIDFSKYLNQVIDFKAEEQWVRVQPGIVLAELNRYLKPYDLYFPIDPSTKDSATLGGMIANNSSGPHAVKYGTTRSQVSSLELVLTSGEIVQTGPRALPAGPGGTCGAPQTLEDSLYRNIPVILNNYSKYMEPERPFTTKNSCGYYLWDLMADGFLDLTSMLVGSEGTLALVSEATLSLTPVPKKTLSGFVYFDDLGKVGEATQQILEQGPSMIEIMEKHILDLAREQKPELSEYFPENTEATLFIEFQEESNEKLLDKFDSVRKCLLGNNGLAVSVVQARNKEDMANFTQLRSISGPILNRMKGPRRPVAFIEDAAVHVSRLPEYISGLRGLFDKFNVKAAIYGHAGDGNLHTMAILDLSQPEDVNTMLNLADAVFDLVLSLNGTISGEHADGRLRTQYVARQYPNLYHAMQEIKALFDPDGIMNPGVIISENDNLLAENLKYGPDFTIVQTGTSFDATSLQEQIANCSGCAKCRSYCPMASSHLEEWAKGRGKVNLCRELMSGKLDPEILDGPAFKKIIDSCINCKRCLTECPSGVDVPWLSVTGRSDVVRRKGEDFSNRVLTDTATLCRQGSMFAPVANLATSLAPVRWGLEKTIGLEASRYLPRFRNRTLRKILEERKHPDTAREVVFFLGCSANHNDPEGEGLAVIEVLEHNGIRAILPAFKCCGIARISAGAQDKIIDDINYNIALLSEYTAQGLPIVFSEPSCAVAVKCEYPKIVASEEARRVADNCYDIHQYLVEMHTHGELKTDFNRLGMTVGYHAPCHLKALGVTSEPVELMQLIPGLKVHTYSDKCCGMGGTYGLKSKNYDLSMKIGQRLFNEIASSNVDQLISGCGACGMQIRQGTMRESIHPMKLLAAAYQKETVKSEAA
jgi:anaerobic glycerol-3-phosphate dehydrogenase C subunit